MNILSTETDGSWQLVVIVGEMDRDIIIPEIFIIKCNRASKKFRIKAQCQTTKQNKNFQAKIKSLTNGFEIGSSGYIPVSGHWLAVWPPDNYL